MGRPDGHAPPVLGPEIIARPPCMKDVTSLFSEMRGALLPLPLPVPSSLFSPFPLLALCHCVCVVSVWKSERQRRANPMPHRTGPGTKRGDEIEVYMVWGPGFFFPFQKFGLSV
jgi:hypothetical protein